MRKKIALFLSISMINCNMNILANTTDQESGNWGEAVSTPGEAERDMQKVLPEEYIEKLSDVLGEDDTVYNVLFPTQTHAYLDPGNLSGRGQIFSDQYEIENYGNTDVAIKIKKIEIHLKSSEELYEISETAITDDQSSIKKINVDMVWKNKNGAEEKVLHVNNGFPDEYVIRLRAADYDENGEFVSLDQDGTGYFYFTGTLNSNPNLEWDDGELTVSFNYEIVNTSTETNVSTIDTQTGDVGSRDIGQTGTDSNADRDI